LIQQAGLRDILIQRQSHFRIWANPAFWLSLSMGIVAWFVLILLAPISVHFYKLEGDSASELFHLILVLSACAPLNSLGVVADARMQMQLRFRAVAMVNFFTTIGISATSIALSFILPKPYGAYCFVVPIAVFAGVRTSLLWIMSPVRIRLKPQLRRWRYLFGDSVRLLLGSVFFWATNLAGNIVLGRMHGEEAVAAYYFATLISAQTVQHLEVNLLNVLLPTLSRLQNDPPRLLAAFLRATSIIIMVGTPASLLIAAISDPMLKAFFGTKWLIAIPVLQILSIGMALRMASLASVALIKAQGRMFTYLRLYFVWVIIVFALSYLGAAFFENGAVGVAIATTVYFALLGPVNTYIAIRPAGGTTRQIITAYVGPIAASLLSFGVIMVALQFLPEMPGREWIRFALTIVLGGALCFLWLCRFVPRTMFELLHQAQHMLRAAPPAQTLLGFAHRLLVRISPSAQNA
ncbi:MAG TPA: oligosaccharide flippase family protein, partial [Phycisphaerales bacterium]|nr:oligosaccharide flippase family protein [Phycisphaerales bacterium]